MAKNLKKLRDQTPRWVEAGEHVGGTEDANEGVKLDPDGTIRSSVRGAIGRVTSQLYGLILLLAEIYEKEHTGDGTHDAKVIADAIKSLKDKNIADDADIDEAKIKLAFREVVRAKGGTYKTTKELAEDVVELYNKILKSSSLRPTAEERTHTIANLLPNGFLAPFNGVGYVKEINTTSDISTDLAKALWVTTEYELSSPDVSLIEMYRNVIMSYDLKANVAGSVVYLIDNEFTGEIRFKLDEPPEAGTRQDFVGIEFWKEKFTLGNENSVVFPFGNTLYGWFDEGSYNVVSGCTLHKETFDDTVDTVPSYLKTSFGNVSSTKTRSSTHGKYVKCNDKNIQQFIDDPRHNIFLSLDDGYYQLRWRVITSSEVHPEQFENSGHKDVIDPDFFDLGERLIGKASKFVTPASFLKSDRFGWSSIINDEISDVGKVMLLPIAFVHRRNTTPWSWENVNGGTTWAPNKDSGRPDGFYSDIIAEQDVLDLRNRVYGATDSYDDVIKETEMLFYKDELKTHWTSLKIKPPGGGPEKDLKIYGTSHTRADAIENLTSHFDNKDQLNVFPIKYDGLGSFASFSRWFVNFYIPDNSKSDVYPKRRGVSYSPSTKEVTIDLDTRPGWRLDETINNITEWRTYYLRDGSLDWAFRRGAVRHSKISNGVRLTMNLGEIPTSSQIYGTLNIHSKATASWIEKTQQIDAAFGTSLYSEVLYGDKSLFLGATKFAKFYGGQFGQDFGKSSLFFTPFKDKRFLEDYLDMLIVNDVIHLWGIRKVNNKLDVFCDRLDMDMNPVGSREFAGLNLSKTSSEPNWIRVVSANNLFYYYLGGVEELILYHYVSSEAGVTSWSPLQKCEFPPNAFIGLDTYLLTKVHFFYEVNRLKAIIPYGVNSNAYRSQDGVKWSLEKRNVPTREILRFLNLALNKSRSELKLILGGGSINYGFKHFESIRFLTFYKGRLLAIASASGNLDKSGLVYFDYFDEDRIGDITSTLNKFGNFDFNPLKFGRWRADKKTVTYYKSPALYRKKDDKYLTQNIQNQFFEENDTLMQYVPRRRATTRINSRLNYLGDLLYGYLGVGVSTLGSFVIRHKGENFQWNLGDNSYGTSLYYTFSVITHGQPRSLVENTCKKSIFLLKICDRKKGQLIFYFNKVLTLLADSALYPTFRFDLTRLEPRMFAVTLIGRPLNLGKMDKIK